MLNLDNPLIWLYFLYFWSTVFLAFFIPGNLLLRRLSLPFLVRLVLSVIVGMVLWGWQGAIFGYIGLRWLSYVYLLVSLFLWIRYIWGKRLVFFAKRGLTLERDNWLLLLLVVAGVFLQLTTVWSTGVLTAKGLYFCCGNTSDALFHAALTKQLVDRFPPYQPGMYGTIVHNYHYWSNLIVAELVRVFQLPLLATEYQYSTLFISLFLGLSAISLGQVLKVRRAFVFWLVFFLYFGGDLAYFITFLFGKGFNFQMSSMEDGAKFLINMPRAFSIVVFFCGLSLLSYWIKKRDIYMGLLAAIVLGSCIGFKVYTGIFSLVGLAVLAMYFWYRKDFQMVWPLLLAPLASAVIYLPAHV